MRGFFREVPVEIILGVFAFLIIIIFIANAFSGASSLIDKICDILPICGEKPKAEDYYIAKYSFDALSCAINAVLLGEKEGLDCLYYFEEKEELDETTGMATGIQFKGRTRLKCEEKDNGMECEVKDFYLPERFQGVFSKPKEYIAGFGDPSFIIYYQRFPVGEDASWASFSAWWYGIGEAVLWLIPTTPIVKGVVKIFGKAIKIGTSPISVAKAGIKKGFNRVTRKILKMGVEKKILDVTDDTVHAAKHAANILNKVNENTYIAERGLLKRGMRKFLEKFYRSRLNVKVAEELTEREFEKHLVIPERYLTRAEIKETRKSIVELFKRFRNAIAGKNKKEAIKIAKELADDGIDLYQLLPPNARNEILKKMVKEIGTETIKRTMGYAGITTLVAYFAARWECKNGKFIDKPQSMVMQMPLKCSYSELKKSPIFNTPSSNKGEIFSTVKPIILDKDGLNNDVSFYLVSPCHTDLVVKEKYVRCKAYEMVRYDEGYKVECTEPEIEKVSTGTYGGTRMTDKLNGIYCGYRGSSKDAKIYYDFIKEKKKMIDKELTFINKEGEKSIILPLAYNNIGHNINISGFKKIRNEIKENTEGSKYFYGEHADFWRGLGLKTIPQDLLSASYDIYTTLCINISHYKVKVKYADEEKEASMQCMFIPMEYMNEPDGYRGLPKDELGCDYTGEDSVWYCVVDLKGTGAKFYSKEGECKEGCEIKSIRLFGNASKYFYWADMDIKRELIGSGWIIGSIGIDWLKKDNHIIFKDRDEDGKWDEMTLFIPSTLNKDIVFTFSGRVKDGNVVIDRLSSLNCLTKAVVVDVDEDSMKMYKKMDKESGEGKYNYCYSSRSTWRVIASTAITIGVFALDAAAIAGIATSPAVPFIQAAGAYISIKLGQNPDWPNR
ncbi:MAG TPA: hypothetical protein ENG42_03235 [Candidatus Aenigmarchaeota archaeon]|nr:MAG: hypothetical protein DRP03_01865 [Candidatus Aenigmarchaeota archaeon]HDD46465.1 hypothetical protein [Candidatus Aenigmarchaeota archaeon]